MSNPLTYLHSASRISKVEGATPEIVGQQELDLKVAGFADGRGYPEVWVRSEQAWLRKELPEKRPEASLGKVKTLSSTVISSSWVGCRAACNASRVECYSILVENRWQWNNAHGRCCTPVERRDPIKSNEPVDNSNLAKTHRYRPTIGSNALLVVSAWTCGSDRRAETAGDNAED
jgi:hypothetical protein